jgi:hypothetical protein
LNILLTSHFDSHGRSHIWIPRGGLRTALICYRKYDDCSHTHFLVDTAHNATKMWGELHLHPYGLSHSNLRYLQMYYLRKIMWHDWHYSHFLSCKAKVRVKLAKTGHGPYSSKSVVICLVLLLFVLFHVLFVCKCVLYYCHRVTTQLQLTNISKIHIP